MGKYGDNFRIYSNMLQILQDIYINVFLKKYELSNIIFFCYVSEVMNERKA